MDQDVVVRAQRGDREAYEALARTLPRACTSPPIGSSATQIARTKPSSRRSSRCGGSFRACATRLVSRPGRTDWSSGSVSSSRAERVAAASGRSRSTRRFPCRPTPSPTRIFGISSIGPSASCPGSPAVVVLHHYAGLSLAEIASILGVPYGTVGSRLHHATRSLRAAIAAGDRTRSSEGSRHDRDPRRDRILAEVLEGRGPTSVPAALVDAALAQASSIGQRRPIVPVFDRRAWPADGPRWQTLRRVGWPWSASSSSWCSRSSALQSLSEAACSITPRPSPGPRPLRWARHVPRPRPPCSPTAPCW